MTQAFNLGQLANKVNTSGQLDASTGLVNSAAVANGGTGRATLDVGKVLIGNGTSQVDMLAGTTTNDVLLWSGSAWISSPAAAAGAGGGYQLASYTSPSSYTKPASLKAIKVTVVGAGGNGGTAAAPVATAVAAVGGGGGGGASIYYAPAATLPASAIPISAGAGTNSFGAVASATAGAAGTPGQSGAGGSGGIGSSGTINIQGSAGNNSTSAIIQSGSGNGGSSILGGGARGVAFPSNAVGNAGGNYGGGGGGGLKSSPSPTTSWPGGAGAPGIVIIEEFF